MTGVEMLAAGSAIVGAVGAIQQGKAQQSMANYNADVAERAAENAKVAAAFEESAQRSRADKFRSTQRALFAKSGVTQEGSPLLVEADTAAQAEQDALAIRFSGSAAEARAKSQAAMSRMGGRVAKQASMYKAGTSLLSGASRLKL
jgi:hypothetical protein